MKTRIIIHSLCVSCLLTLTVFANGKTDFSGQWIMDKAQSTGLPADMLQRMKVEQAGDKVEIETDIYQGDNIQTISDSYTLDGKPTEYATQLPSGEKTMAKRTAKWNQSGDGFEINDSAEFETANGKVTIITKRKWAMAADNKSIVIELTRTSPNGTTTNTRTFKRK